MRRRCRCAQPECFDCGKSRALSCTSKRAYLSLQEAEQAASQARDRTSDVIIRYRCHWAEHWHIGHPSGGRAYRIAAKRLEKARRKQLVRTQGQEQQT